MQNRNLKKLALLGLLSGSIVANTGEKLHAVDDKPSSDQSQDSGNIGYHVMTEEELLNELNDEGTKTFNELSKDGKILALKMASQRCQGTNDCKGQNACKTDKNDCAGQGQCKGQGKCAFSDKNLAVKIAAKVMKEKREKASAQ